MCREGKDRPPPRPPCGLYVSENLSGPWDLRFLKNIERKYTMNPEKYPSINVRI
jgi:hypothetical protein